MLTLLVTFAGFALGFVVSFRAERAGEALVCLISAGSVVVVVSQIPKIGIERCPYCESWAVRPGDEGRFLCDLCGSRCEREGRRRLRLIASPSDDRPWVALFLPKLQRIRSDLRPGRGG